MDISHKKEEEVSYPLGDNDRYVDESKDTLKSILNDDVPTDSGGKVRKVDDMHPCWKKWSIKVTIKYIL